MTSNTNLNLNQFLNLTEMQINFSSRLKRKIVSWLFKSVMFKLTTLHQHQHQQSRIGSAERCTFYLSRLLMDIVWQADSRAAEAAVGFTPTTTSSQQGPDVVPNPKWSRRHTRSSYLEPVHICTRRFETRYVQCSSAYSGPSFQVQSGCGTLCQ